MRKLLFTWIIFVSTTLSCYAENALGMREPLKQGGYYVGKVSLGDKVTFHGKTVKQSPDGTFVIALGWKYKAKANIRVDHKAGGHTMHQLDVMPHDYETEEISGLPPKYVAPPKEVQARISKDAADVRRVRAMDSDLQNFREQMIWPVEGRISGRFGSHRILNGEPRSPHTGLDIAPGQGALIVAPLGGKVTLLSDQYLTGNTMVIDHGHGISSVYAHMERAIASEGQTVKQGDPIGTVGMSGRATGPHLHWGMNWYGERLNAGVALGIE
ncbi:MAG: M23 family metallopeptidase [Kordiimonadaceae bacterium]|jgi:murein DD-endopeptidase MepM/ murein hydrolase activator NlpD|nr:M23 family metallopeptidase [Kordiimonadaceae bacterium]MBT6037234.1 M23 family metallopeptidase [Kordiimonadaceae bacterium]MBT6329812.1 M23 family metallopeptidase [Kordiimonadaceae bacterium]MBT7583298.1 M23 family metallopeptidase [Kordiimonadaceae bacterium]